MKKRKTRTWRALAVLLVIPALVVPSATGLADQTRRGTTVLVSTFPDGTPADGGFSDISADGRYVVFDSIDRLATEDTDSFADVYRKDMMTGQTILISQNPSNF